MIFFKTCRLRLLPVVLIGPLLAVAQTGRQAQPASTPAQAAAFSNVDAIMENAVADGNIPGGVVLIGHNGKIIYRKAFGERSLEPMREAMTVDTIFDLASLTKCIATTTAVMQLIEQGRIRLNDPVAAYLKDFAQNGKQDITIRELMTHYSGLGPDLDLTAPWEGRDALFAWRWRRGQRIRPAPALYTATSTSRRWDFWSSRSRGDR